LASSLLERAGLRDVWNVTGGGMADLPSRGVALVQG
jgi:hypothetical protein